RADRYLTVGLFLLSVCMLLFFFFFQAEDGIRDGHVTGVQTCALPISAPSCGSSRGALARSRWSRIWWWTAVRSTGSFRRAGSSRSEERRVGKECRSRWSAEH